MCRVWVWPKVTSLPASYGAKHRRNRGETLTIGQGVGARLPVAIRVVVVAPLQSGAECRSTRPRSGEEIQGNACVAHVDNPRTRRARSTWSSGSSRFMYTPERRRNGARGRNITCAALPIWIWRMSDITTWRRVELREADSRRRNTSL